MTVREYLRTVQHHATSFTSVRFGALISLSLLLSLVAACTPAGKTNTSVVQTARDKKSEQVIEVSTVVVSSMEDAEVQAEFERAKGLLLAGEHRAAAELFDKLAKARPDSEVEPPCLYNAGVAYETFGAWDESLSRYRDLVRKYPSYALERSTLVRTSRILAQVERWSELVVVADKLLQRADLAMLETIEVRGMRGLGLIEQDLIVEAEREVSMARDIIEQQRFGEAGKPPVELAVVWFALGEVRRKKSEQIGFVPEPANFAETLERRCQGLLDAQRAYTDSMRSLDARWSAMAGYRLGQLYQDLYRDVMRASVPKGADTLRKKQLFEGAMRLRYRVLLEKGLDMMRGTVRLGDRTGESSAWVTRAKESERALELALQDEKAALAKMPFTEQELREALESLKKKP